MESDMQAQVKRIDELERRVEHLENHLVTRDVLDDEIRSLERADGGLGPGQHLRGSDRIDR